MRWKCRPTTRRGGWLEEWTRRRLRPLADRFRDPVVRTYGEEHGRRVEYVEAFEASEYGAPFDAAARERLFPFAPKASGAASARRCRTTPPK